MTTGLDRLPAGTAMTASCTVLYFALPSAATTNSVCAAALTEPRVRPVSSQHSLNVHGAKKTLIFIRQRADTTYGVRP
jgi:hypothetical protein